MRTYVMLTGAVFALLTLSHVLRFVEEGAQIASDPWFVIVTFVAAGLAIWAWRLLWPGGQS